MYDLWAAVEGELRARGKGLPWGWKTFEYGGVEKCGGMKWSRNVSQGEIGIDGVFETG